MFLCNPCQGIVLLNFSTVVSFSSKYVFTFSQNQCNFDVTYNYIIYNGRKVL